MHIQNLWTEEEITVLRREWGNGVSCREIGKLINRSKNAVIGKAHRLDLAERPKNPKPVPSVKKVRVKITVIEMVAPPKRRVPKAPTFYAPEGPLSGSVPIGIMELTRDSCRSIVGYGPNGLAVYCGDQTFLGKSFCPTHCALYYREPERRIRA